MKPIYLDYNATTPILPEVAEVMHPYLDKYFGNPSSSHKYGKEVAQEINKSREHIAKLLNCSLKELIFTSGGSESNNYAIKGVALKNREKGNHIITSSIEHPAVKEVCRYLETQGFEVTYLGVDEFGIINLNELRQAIKNKTILITIMHANNEVGSIQPIKEIAEIAKKNQVLFHTDAAQSVGKIKTDIQELGIDLLSVAGHKLYAPKGIGALFVKDKIEIEKLIHGANHEINRRAGTENIMEIAGLGKACETSFKKLDKNIKHLKEMRDRLESGLIRNFKNQKINNKYILKINGHPKHRLPNTLSISFLGIEANKILSKIENEVAASAGAACHSEGITISDTLAAMQVPMEYAMGTLRLSTGKFTTEKEVDKSIEVIVNAINTFLRN